MKAIIFYDHGRRSKTIAEAMHCGMRRRGVAAKLRHAREFAGKTYGDVAVFYGLRGNLKSIHEQYISEGKKVVFVDLGYWGRLDGGALCGYHRVVVNGFHANDYFQNIEHRSDRSNKFKLGVNERVYGGNYILLAGMSAKSAWVYDLKPEEFERETIRALRALTDTKIVYRPKPTWTGSTKGLMGAGHSGSEQSFKEAAMGASVVVSHHSNAAVEAILLGKPAITLHDGVGKKVADSLGSINEPFFPSVSDTRQWVNDIAYTQWNVHEMKSGVVWDHLIREGLI